MARADRTIAAGAGMIPEAKGTLAPKWAFRTLLGSSCRDRTGARLQASAACAGSIVNESEIPDAPNLEHVDYYFVPIHRYSRASLQGRPESRIGFSLEELV